MKKAPLFLALLGTSPFVWANTVENLPVETLTLEKIKLGRQLFFDKNLSKNRTMSCASCHSPANAMVDKRPNKVNQSASLGDDGHSIGDRNAPTAAYAQFSPDFHAVTEKGEKVFIGGQFLDGRVKDLAAQAGGPPTNPIEMGMPSQQATVQRISENPKYIATFKQLYGEQIFQDPKQAYAAMTDAISAFESTEFFAPFDSKYDRFLRGEYDLTVLEDLGRSLFFSNNNTNCSTCHKLKREDAEKEVFSDFRYYNLGVPENIALRKVNGVKTKDLGLYQNPQAQTENNKGKFKTSTLRNVAVTGPYMHNGVFQDLRTVILFYDHYNNPKNKINPETGQPWRDPEVNQNLSPDLKMKVLTPRKVDALVAFLELLTDKRYEPLLAQQKAAKMKKDTNQPNN